MVPSAQGISWDLPALQAGGEIVVPRKRPLPPPQAESRFWGGRIAFADMMIEPRQEVLFSLHGRSACQQKNSRDGSRIFVSRVDFCRTKATSSWNSLDPIYSSHDNFF